MYADMQCYTRITKKCFPNNIIDKTENIYLDNISINITKCIHINNSY